MVNFTVNVVNITTMAVSVTTKVVTFIRGFTIHFLLGNVYEKQYCVSEQAVLCL